MENPNRETCTIDGPGMPGLLRRRLRVADVDGSSGKPQLRSSVSPLFLLRPLLPKIRRKLLIPMLSVFWPAITRRLSSLPPTS